MKQIFIRFKANKTGFIHLFCIEANPWILHAKMNKNVVKANILKQNEVTIFKKN
jgi:hypothetical protein